MTAHPSKQRCPAQIGHDPLQLGVLRFKLLEPLSLADAHAAELRLPLVEYGRTDIVLATDLAGGNAAFVLFEDADNLLLGESSFHARILPFRIKFSQLLVAFSGANAARRGIGYRMARALILPEWQGEFGALNPKCVYRLWKAERLTRK